MFREGAFIEESFDINMFHQTMDWIVSTIDAIILETEWKVCPSAFFCRFVCSVFDHCPARDAVLYSPKKGT